MYASRHFVAIEEERSDSTKQSRTRLERSKSGLKCESIQELTNGLTTWEGKFVALDINSERDFMVEAGDSMKLSYEITHEVSEREETIW